MSTRKRNSVAKTATGTEDSAMVRKTRTPKPLGSFWTNYNPRKVWCLKANAPTWLSEAVYSAHDGTPPNDWIHDTARAVCLAIDDGALTCEDDIHEFSDGQVDIDNGEIAQWYVDLQGSNLFSQAEESADEGRDGAETSTNDRLMRIQYYAISYIAREIFRAWEQSR